MNALIPGLARPAVKLNCGAFLAVFQANGDVGVLRGIEDGLFYNDTRYLSFYELRADGCSPSVLGSWADDGGAAFTVDLSDPDFNEGGADTSAQAKLFARRTKVVGSNACHERLNLRNLGDRGRIFSFELRFDADFRDILEIRGEHRDRRGEKSVKVAGRDRVDFVYAGVDGVLRTTSIRFSPTPHRLSEGMAVFEIDLDAGGQCSIYTRIACVESGRPETTPNHERDLRPGFFAEYRSRRRTLKQKAGRFARIGGSSKSAVDTLARSTADLCGLLSPTGHGDYPFAGLPWYNGVTGRDGLITAFLALWCCPYIARGVLRHLAATQATSFDGKAEASPGKILHSSREGEMSRAGAVPFHCYYGTVDATPLFVLLAGRYYRRTGDRETLRLIWPQLNAALQWMDRHGDLDGDGFIEYRKGPEEGLVNQGWKDSDTSVFHADGSDAEGPIALCEVQSYAFAARRAAAFLFDEFGEPLAARRLRGEAETLRQRFEEAFWCEEIGTYCLALDGEKRQCRVRASNAGQVLFGGIASPERARRTASWLMSEESFSGWGIRTLARGEIRYDPISYHNGSVWPHDNALIGLGFARYGFTAEAARLCEAMLTASAQQHMNQLPELMCGFRRRKSQGPTPYPTACSPQAFAAAAPFALLAAALGLDIDRRSHAVRFHDPVMPDGLDELLIEGLEVDAVRATLRVRRDADAIEATVLSGEGNLRASICGSGEAASQPA